MRLKLYLFAGVLLLASVIHGEEFNEIDGTTSASGRLVLKGGKAYSTSAEVTWNDRYSNGSEHLLKWGEESLDNNKSLKPFSNYTDITTMITGLKPNTSYNGQFYRVWRGVTYKTDFTFVTVKDGGIVVPVAEQILSPNSGLSVSVKSIKGGALLKFKSNDVENISYSIIDVSGKCLKKSSVIFSSVGNKNLLTQLNPGFYIALIDCEFQNLRVPFTVIR